MNILLKFGIGAASSTFGLSRFAMPRYQMGFSEMGFAVNLFSKKPQFFRKHNFNIHTNYVCVQLCRKCELSTIISKVIYRLKLALSYDTFYVEGEKVFLGLAKKVTISKKSTFFVRT